MTTPVLSVKDMAVRFSTPEGPVSAVNGVSFDVNLGECVGVVGESGSGKSQTFMAVMGLLAGNGKATGSAKFKGEELVGMKVDKLNKIRGSKMTMIFQDPMTSLTPHLKISRQLTEVLVLHKGMSERDARAKAVQMLDRVKIPDAKRRLDQYPHEFSGGMRQRVMIAMALMGGPRVLIADEPTTALDVSARAAMLELLGRLRTERGLGVLLITHDLHTVQQSADVVCVMRAGRVLEYGRTAEVFARPLHSYTRGLMQCEPSLLSRGKPLSMVDDQPNGGVGGLGRLCEVEPNRWVRVYDEVDLPSESSRSGSHPDIEPGHRAPLSSRGSPTTPGPFG